jgi:hypothetical protein
VLAWCVLVVVTLTAAWLFQLGVSSGLDAPAQAAATPVQLSSATAALSDGDDVRARLLVERPELASFLVRRPNP